MKLKENQLIKGNWYKVKTDGNYNYIFKFNKIREDDIYTDKWYDLDDNHGDNEKNNNCFTYSELDIIENADLSLVKKHFPREKLNLSYEIY